MFMAAKTSKKTGGGRLSCDQAARAGLIALQASIRP
jgi:hypothetical protein